MRLREEGGVVEVLGGVSAWSVGGEGRLTVIRRVLVGFAGCVNGGRQDRSRLRCEPREEARERAGEAPGEAMGCRPGEAAGESWRGDSIASVVECWLVGCRWGCGDVGMGLGDEVRGVEVSPSSLY